MCVCVYARLCVCLGVCVFVYVSLYTSVRMCVYLHSANLTLSMRAIRFVKKEIQAASQALCYTDYKDTQFVCVCVRACVCVGQSHVNLCLSLCYMCVYVYCTKWSTVLLSLKSEWACLQL